MRIKSCSRLCNYHVAEPGLKLRRLDPKVLAVNHSHQAHLATHHSSPWGMHGCGEKGRNEGQGKLIWICKPYVRVKRPLSTSLHVSILLFPLGSPGRGKGDSNSVLSQVLCLWPHSNCWAAPSCLSHPSRGQVQCQSKWSAVRKALLWAPSEAGQMERCPGDTPWS